MLSPAARAANLYCQCDTIAASPNQIKLEWPSSDGNTVSLSLSDVCEGPQVPSAFAPSPGIFYEPHEVELYTDARFMAARDSLVAQAEEELAIPAATMAGYVASRSAILTAMQAALQTDANTKKQANARMDLVAGGVQAGAVGAAQVAPFYVLALSPGLNSNAIAAAADALLLDLAATDATLEAAYNGVSGDTQGATVSEAMFALLCTCSSFLARMECLSGSSCIDRRQWLLGRPHHPSTVHGVGSPRQSPCEIPCLGCRFNPLWRGCDAQRIRLRVHGACRLCRDSDQRQPACLGGHCLWRHCSCKCQ